MTEEELKDLTLYKISVMVLDRLKIKEVLTPGLIKEEVKKLLDNPLVDGGDDIYQEEIEKLLVNDIYHFDIIKNSLEVESGLSLTDPSKHSPWELPDSWYYWEKHKEFVIAEYKKKDPDNWERIIRSMDLETDEILSSIENPVREGFDSHGLVIGYVQSGKTANFTALIAKAMDCGYQLVIVLAGMHNTLRVQTQARLDRELLGYDDLNTDKPNISSLIEKRRLPIRATTTQYTDSFDEKVADGEFHSRVTKLKDLIEVNDRYNKVTAVVKKNVRVLEKLNEWVDSCPANIRKQVPLLVIDDEADQASVDANYLTNKRKNNSLKENVTQTNKEITSLLGKFDRSSYIGYTATPFANCFIDPSYQNLYPKNLIHFLPKPESYFGAMEIFGNQDLKNAYVKTKDVESKAKFFDGIVKDRLPKSLEKALYTFLISVAIRVLRKESDEPMSMLVHITHEKAGMKEVYNAIETKKNALSHSIGKKTVSALKTKDCMKSLWEDMKKSGKLINKETNTGNRDFFTFERVYRTIIKEINSIELKGVHSDSDDELDYANNPSLRVIAIGGNKLSRGLTLDGLLTTFFLRSTNNADTLMQMGRFFGYRRDYHDLMRVYCTAKIVSEFEYLIALESDLRSEVSRYRDEGLTPLDFAPTVRVHSRMRPSGKMGNAKVFKNNFGSSIIQTKYFKLKDSKFIEINNEIVENLVNQLVKDNKGKPEKPLNKKSPGKVFYNVEVKTVTDFLGKYKLADNDFLADDVIRYINKKGFNRFNVGIADLKSTDNIKFGNAGSFALVQRSRKKTEYGDGFFNIGTLTEQRHLEMDIKDSEKGAIETRKIPLLVLYRIDSNSKVTTGEGRLDLFKDINNKVDISCYGIVMPKSRAEDNDVWGQEF